MSDSSFKDKIHILNLSSTPTIQKEANVLLHDQKYHLSIGDKSLRLLYGFLAEKRSIFRAKNALK